MKDLKLKRAISGLGGADCILCITKQYDWKDASQIKKGFAINRSAAETWELFAKLVTPDGNILTKANDFETRQGLTQKPITCSDQHSITITHSYINCVNCVTKNLEVVSKVHITASV